MGRVDWMLGQVLFWIMIVAIILAGVMGIRRAGTVLAAHQAALVAGRDVYGAEAGLSQAGLDLNVWWGIAPGDASKVVSLETDPLRRSIRVVIEGVMPTLFGGEATLGAGSFQRVEEFYPGPPEEDGWE
jgi:hypothetical protein